MMKLKTAGLSNFQGGIRGKDGGADGDRTPDLLTASQAL